MQDTPDLSKIINVIMQNPTLISEIASLANASKAQEPAIEESAPIISESQDRNEAVVAESEPRSKSKSKRRDLLNAMKPYLSETRRGAIDSMASIFDIIDVMMRKES